MKRLPAILIAALFLGCQPAPEEGASVGQAPEAPATAGPEVTAIELNDGGLDGYPAGSPLDIDMMREAVAEHGYELVEAVGGSEGEEWTVFHVKDGDEVVLEIGPDPVGARVGSVTTSSAVVTTDTGFGVGDRFGDVYADNEPDCEAGMEEMSGRAVCYAPDRVQLYFVFDGSWNGPDGELPPTDVLADWTVGSIVWSVY